MNLLTTVPCYGFGAAAIWLSTVGVRRSVPRRAFLLLMLCPLVLFFHSFFLDKTLLPADQATFALSSDSRFARPFNPWLNDLATQILPWAQAVRSAWRAGEIPHRNRFVGCGTPLAANGQSAAFSPFTLLQVILPLSAAFSTAAALKILLALTGMWLWLREMGVSAAASGFGAVSFAFSFSVIPWLFFPMSAVICLWPWAFFAVELLKDPQVGVRALCLLVGIFALWPLNGHIESAASCAALLSFFLLLRFVFRDESAQVRRVWPRLLVAGGCALALTAAALVPLGLAILSSNRLVLVREPYWKPFLSWTPHPPVWPGGPLALFSPRAFGDGITSPMVSSAVAPYPEMALGYFGIIGFVCACLLARPGSKRRRVTWALLGVCIVACGVGFGVWPFAELAAATPIYQMIFPTRILSWVSLCGSALAAIELDRLVRDSEASRQPLLAAVGISMVVAAGVALTYRYQSPLHVAVGGLKSQLHALIAAEALLVAFGLVAVIFVMFWRRRFSAVPFVLGVLSFGELCWQGQRQYKPATADMLFQSSPLIEFLRRQARPFRIVGEASTLFPMTGVFAGVEDIRTHDPVERRDYVQLLDRGLGYQPSSYFKKVGNVNAPLLDFLNVRFLVSWQGRQSPGPKWRSVYSGVDGTAFENQATWPRVFAPPEVEGFGSSLSGRRWVRNAFEDFEPVVERLAGLKDWGARPLVLGLTPGVVPNSKAEIYGYEEATNWIHFRAHVAGGDRPAVVVTSLVQDGGWRARDDAAGELSTTLANGPFLALLVPPGERLVTLEYAAPGWRAGAAISGLAVLLACVIAFGRRRSLRERRPRVSKPEPVPRRASERAGR